MSICSIAAAGTDRSRTCGRSPSKSSSTWSGRSLMLTAAGTPVAGDHCRDDRRRADHAAARWRADEFGVADQLSRFARRRRAAGAAGDAQTMMRVGAAAGVPLLIVSLALRYAGFTGAPFEVALDLGVSLASAWMVGSAAQGLGGLAGSVLSARPALPRHDQLRRLPVSRLHAVRARPLHRRDSSPCRGRCEPCC